LPGGLCLSREKFDNILRDLLTEDGFKVSVVQQPETALEDDVLATQRVLDQQDAPSSSATVTAGRSSPTLVTTRRSSRWSMSLR
jgi:hypothetical protein